MSEKANDRNPNMVFTLIDSAEVTSYPLLLHLSAGVQITCEIAAVPCESKGTCLFKQLELLLLAILKRYISKGAGAHRQNRVIPSPHRSGNPLNRIT